MIEIIIAVLGVLLGSGISFFLVNSKNNGKAKLIIEEAQKNAEQIKKEKILQAKERFIELKSDHEKVIIKKNNDIYNWSEVEFEQEEKAHHTRRGFELLYRNLIEYGRGKEATLEYLQQYGVHVQLAITEVSGYIEHVNTLIKSGEILTSLHLEDFLDEMKDKYAKNSDEVSKKLFGTTDITNKEYMTLIGEEK